MKFILIVMTFSLLSFGCIGQKVNNLKVEKVYLDNTDTTKKKAAERREREKKKCCHNNNPFRLGYGIIFGLTPCEGLKNIFVPVAYQSRKLRKIKVYGFFFLCNPLLESCTLPFFLAP